MSMYEPLSKSALVALLREELEVQASIKMLVERLHTLRKSEPCWSIREEIKNINRQLSRRLARNNAINSILIDRGARNSNE